jgi:tRNA threonylcarbamoyladenosine biosynthesis protein TsaE
MGIVARTKSVEQTRELAAALAELARPGDLLLLAGDLGAGKTAFSQGFGRGLGVPGPITSPTFTLAREHEGGRIRLHHLDVYRLEQLEEVLDVGLPELLDDDAVTLIEWGDAIVPALPNDYLEVRLTFLEADDDRELAFTVVGPGWSARTRALSQAVSPWVAGGGGC